MFIYLTSEKNNVIFDFLKDQSGQTVKKFIGDFNFQEFVSDHLMSYDSCRYLAVDLECIDDYPDGFFDAVDSILQYFNFHLRLIVVSFDLDGDILAGLYKRGVFNIITGTDKDTVEKRILKVFSQDGMSPEDHNLGDAFSSLKSSNIPIATPVQDDLIPTIQTVIKNESVFEEKIIAVVGSQRRTGTSTTAFQLANYIASKGKSVAYMEGNNHQHLKEIVKTYKMEERDQVWQMNGVDYLFSDSEFFKHYHYIIADLGELNEDKVEFIKNSHFVILCGDAKCYEKNHLIQAITFLKSSGISAYHLFLHFVAPNELLLLKSQYEDAYFFETTPQLFGWTVNSKLFKRLLSK